MGTWSTSITGDDSVQDVICEYLHYFNQQMPAAEIVSQVLQSNADMLHDMDEGPLFWIAIAKAQWDCGQLQPEVLAQVRSIIEQGVGLERWAAEGPRLLATRTKVLEKFLLEIQTPKLRPLKPKKATKRRPIFAPGDCVAVRLDEGDWGGVYVLPREPESDDPFVTTYGFNRIVFLNSRSVTQPTLAAFEQRDWYHDRLQSRWFRAEEWKVTLRSLDVMSAGFRKIKDRFEIIARIEVRPTDRVKDGQLTTWNSVLSGPPAAAKPPTAL